MKRSAVYIAVLLILLIVAAVLCLNALNRYSDMPEPSPTPTGTVWTQAPTEEPTEPPEESREPAPEPTDTLPPIETREPIETPEVTREPVTVSASGSFASDTGTYLNLLVEWSAYTDAGGNNKLTVDVSAMSYAFYTDSLYNAIELTIGGETWYFNSPAVSYDGRELAVTPMVSNTIDAPAGNTAISVVWNYKGSYSGVELEKISAKGTAYIN